MTANVIITGDVSDGIPNEIIEIINSLSMHDVKSACVEKTLNGKYYSVIYKRIKEEKNELS